MNSISVNPPVKKITCIQLSGVFPDFCHVLIMPRYGMPLIGTILAEAGYDVKVYIEYVKPPEWSRIAASDLICISTLSTAAEKTYRLAKKIRSELHIPVIFGGTHATYFTESCLDYCDYVVLGEGDETIIELCHAVFQGGDVSMIPGIAYKKNGKVVKTANRPGPLKFNTIPNYKLINGYKKLSLLDMILKRRRPLLTVQATRGCPFRCKFCIVSTMFSGGYRTRDIESVIADLKDKSKYGRSFMFVDNNFTAQPAYAKKLLRRMIEENLQLDIMVFTRIDIAKDDELLELMRKAGIRTLYQGYESLQADTLAGYHKCQTGKRIKAAIEKFHQFDFRLTGSFIFGADNDTLETINSTVQFVLDTRIDFPLFFPLWGLYSEEKNQNSSFIPRYRSIFKDWAHCDGSFVTHFPLQMRPSELQIGIINAHRKIFSTKVISRFLKERRIAEFVEVVFRKWMWSQIEKSLFTYVPWLQRLEHGLYNSENRLKEDLLKKQASSGPWPLLPACGIDKR